MGWVSYKSYSQSKSVFWNWFPGLTQLIALLLESCCSGSKEAWVGRLQDKTLPKLRCVAFVSSGDCWWPDTFLVQTMRYKCSRRRMREWQLGCQVGVQGWGTILVGDHGAGSQPENGGFPWEATGNTQCWPAELRKDISGAETCKLDILRIWSSVRGAKRAKMSPGHLETIQKILKSCL